MGKKVRERKLQKVKEKKFEKKAIELRKKQITAPYIRTTVRVIVTIILTSALLYLGTFANKKIQANEGVNSTPTPSPATVQNTDTKTEPSFEELQKLNEGVTE